MPPHHLNRARAHTALAALVALLLGACRGDGNSSAELLVPGGDPKAGAGLISAFGCGACHTIPGIDGARGVVGPPLTAFGSRAYIAGAVPNAPENLIRWIMDPHSIEPGTAMPMLGVPEPTARDIAAYLYTLR